MQEHVCFRLRLCVDRHRPARPKSECCVLCFIRNRDADCHCHCHGGGEVKSWHRICVRRSLPARSSNSSCIRLPAGTYFFIIDGVWGGHGMLGPWGAGTSSLHSFLSARGGQKRAVPPACSPILRSLKNHHRQHGARQPVHHHCPCSSSCSSAAHLRAPRST